MGLSLKRSSVMELVRILPSRFPAGAIPSNKPAKSISCLQGLPGLAVLVSFYLVALYRWGLLGYNCKDGHLNGEPGTTAIRRQRACLTGTAWVMTGGPARTQSRLLWWRYCRVPFFGRLGLYATTRSGSVSGHPCIKAHRLLQRVCFWLTYYKGGA